MTPLRICATFQLSFLSLNRVVEYEFHRAGRLVVVVVAYNNSASVGRKLLTAADPSGNARVDGRENERRTTKFSCRSVGVRPRPVLGATPGRHTRTPACVAVFGHITPHAFTTRTPPPPRTSHEGASYTATWTTEILREQSSPGIQTFLPDIPPVGLTPPATTI